VRGPFAFPVDGLTALIRGYRHFLPAIALNWLLVGVAASQIPAAPRIAQAGLAILFFAFYAAAAARACGIGGTTAARLALERAGSMIESLLLAMLLALIWVGTVAGGLAFGSPAPVVLSSLAAVVSGWIIARSWPVVGVAFLVEGGTRWSPSARGAIWSGPGIGLAWKLTGQRGAHLGHTLPFLLAATVLCAGQAALWLIAGEGILSDLFLFAVALPGIAVFAVRGAAALMTLRAATSGAEHA